MLYLWHVWPMWRHASPDSSLPWRVNDLSQRAYDDPSLLVCILSSSYSNIVAVRFWWRDLQLLPYTMTPQHESPSNCPSAGRIINRMFLSFLALASSIVAGSSRLGILQDAAHPQPPPIMGPGPIIPGTTESDEYGKSHTFVRIVYCLQPSKLC